MKIDTPRNREIRRLRKEERMTLDAIGRRFGLSRERVRQIVRGIEAIMGEENGNVSDIRAAGDGENNNTSEHGGRRPGEGG
jgi:transcriptional regulator with XRE-family HTH domain|tara:strand:- start:263 stop:505 length:243 start_codon:yes stop_codon:yes gene_type:complete